MTETMAWMADVRAESDDRLESLRRLFDRRGAGG
jgi:hypothetical protein